MNASASYILAGTISQLSRHFDKRQLRAASMPDLERNLAVLVRHLLRTNLNRLLQILYLMDVEEQQVRTALRLPAEEEVATTIAHIIIKRELQRLQTRFTYNQN